MEMNYCRRCGRPLAETSQNTFTCDAEHVVYVNPSPTVGVFFFNSTGEILFGVRGVEPNIGTLDTPGGFLEPGESIEKGLEREIKEELGLDPSDYSALTYLTSAPSQYSFKGEDYSVLSSLFTARLADGKEPVAADDISDLRWLLPENVQIDDIGNDDIKAGFRTLLEHLPLP